MMTEAMRAALRGEEKRRVMMQTEGDAREYIQGIDWS